MENKPKVFLRKNSKTELEKEIVGCSSCKYWKTKSKSYPWGDRPCKKHGEKLTQLEDEVSEITGKRYIGIIEDSKIIITLKPTFNQLLGAVLKTPPIKKVKEKRK